MMRPTFNARGRGFSVVELMIAMALSSVVIVSMASLFISNSQTMKVQRALLDVNDSGRYALDRIARDLRNLGYRDGGYNVPGGESLPNSLIATTGDSDTLTVVFEAPFDCNRVAADATGRVTNVYAVVNDNLTCNGQILTRGVEELRVLLGEDLDADGVANRYVLADAAGLDLERVVSVQLQLLVRSSDDNVISSQQALNLEWNKQLIDPRRLRQEYLLTVALRNRIGAP